MGAYGLELHARAAAPCGQDPSVAAVRCAMLQEGLTALMFLANCGDTAMVTEFVSRGANPNAQDKARTVACCTAVC